MRIRILVNTPKGEAAKAQKRLRTFILGLQRPDRTGTNKTDSSFYWELETNVRRAMKIQRNVARYETIISMLFDHKLLKKVASERLSKQEQKELKGMLTKGTTIKIIKNATAEELVEDGKTYWQRVKDQFRH